MQKNTYDRFAAQKKYLLKNRNVSILFLIYSFGFLLLLISVVIKIGGLLYILLLPLLLMLAAIYSFVKFQRLLKQFSRIKAGETYEVKLYRPKVTLMLYTPFSGRKHHVNKPLFYGVILTDYQKKKYHYFLGESFPLDNQDAKKLKAKLYRELHIRCYANTTLIQAIEDDPHFLKIKMKYYNE